MFPLLSRMANDDWQGVSVLYVCPLRALLNNLQPRIDGYARWLGRAAAVWHGDVGQSQRQRILVDRPDILLTTPESLESMLVSTKVDPRVLFSGSAAVVVDEIHAFAGDDRGWHLLAVLERLVTDRRPRSAANRVVRDRRQPRRAAGLAAGQFPRARFDGHRAHGSRRDRCTGNHGRFRGLDCPTPPPSLRPCTPARSAWCSSTAAARQKSSAPRCGSTGSKPTSRTRRCRPRNDGAPKPRSPKRATPSSSPPRPLSSASTSATSTGSSRSDRHAPSRRFCSGWAEPAGARKPPATACSSALDDESVLLAAGMLKRWSEGWVEPIEPPAHPRHIAAQQLMALCLQEHRISAGEWRAGGATFRYSTRPPATSSHTSSPRATSKPTARSCTSAPRPSVASVDGTSPTSPRCSRPAGVPGAGGPSRGRDHRHRPAHRGGRGPRMLLLGGRSWKVTHVDWERRRCFVEPVDGGGRAKWSGSSGGLSYDITRGMRDVVLGALPMGVDVHRPRHHCSRSFADNYSDNVATERLIVRLPVGLDGSLVDVGGHRGEQDPAGVAAQRRRPTSAD